MVAGRREAGTLAGEPATSGLGERRVRGGNGEFHDGRRTWRCTLNVRRRADVRRRVRVAAAAVHFPARHGDYGAGMIDGYDDPRLAD